MRRCERVALTAVLGLIAWAGEVVPRYYRPEDWVTYTDFSYVRSVAVDLRYVYAGTDGGIACFNRVTRRWDHPLTMGDGLPELPVRVVAPDPTTRSLWVVTRTKLCRYDPALEEWRSFGILDATPASLVEAIGIGNQFIYARAGAQTYRMDRVKEVWEPSPSQSSEVRWYGGEQNLRKYPFLAPYYVLDARLRRYNMTSLDQDGFDIWIGTSGYGLLHYNSRTLSREHRFFGLGGESVRALSKDGPTLWIGGESDRITAWNQDQDTWRYYDEESEYGLLSSDVSDIVSDSLWMWLGTQEGLARYDRATGRWKTFTVFERLWANGVTALGVDGDVLWIGTEEGLCRMSTESGKIGRIDEFKYVRISDIVVDSPRVWIATSRGVFVFRQEEETWGRFESPDKSLELGTNSIAIDGERIWFGTEHRGVVCYDVKEGTFTSYQAPVHLATNQVFCVASDGQNLWVGTASGATRFDRRGSSWTTYTQADGLVSNRVESILTDGDHVYFGTPRGMTRFWWNDPFLPK